MPQEWNFSLFVYPQDFFQKLGSINFVPLWNPNFMQNFRKILGAVSKIFKDGRTDGPTDHGQGRLLRNPSGKPRVQNNFIAVHAINLLIW